MNMKKQLLYYVLMLLSIVLFVISITLLGNTTLLAPVIIVISVYLFIGAIIKLCRTNDKLKDNVLCALDLLFWLP